MPAQAMKRGRGSWAAMIVCMAAIAAIPVLGAGGTHKNYDEYDRLAAKAAETGSVRVIVELNVADIGRLTAAANRFCSPAPGEEALWGGGQADLALKDAIFNAAQLALLRLDGLDYEVNHFYSSVPHIALRASAEAVVALRAAPEALAIAEDVPEKLIEPAAGGSEPKGGGAAAGNGAVGADPPLLNNTVNIIGASDAWALGYTGSGWYVAVLDTGIRKTHQFFTGKTVVEACYALGADGSGPAGDCPNGLTSMTGSGAAVHYSSTYTGYDHGTHVSGIATGNYGTLFGVAKDANIIAVKVFSMFSASDCGAASPCVMSYSSDQLAGLDYVYSIRGSYSIAAVNMSLGGGSYSSACDGDARKAAIDNLRAAGIATAIATGNNEYCGYVGAPACISTSVTVGSTTDDDDESSFNNWHATMQRLFAPGSSVNSSTGASDSSYASWSGTSMATPHVAGAWALIKQALPAGSVTDILAALRSSGVSVTSVCDDYTAAIPRILVDEAIQALLPTTVSVVSPNGGESWMVGSPHYITWTSSGAVPLGSVDILYSINGGSDWTAIVADTANDGSYAWTVADAISGNCFIRIREHADGSPSDNSDAVFAIVASSGETVSTPTAPDGPALGVVASGCDFSTGGSLSSLGDGVQYKFDWDDGSDSGWLATGTTGAAHSWAAAGTYDVRAMARCATHTNVESLWSEAHAIVISEGGGGYYNSPAQRLILPEVNWAAVSSGGSWISEVEVTDMSGGSAVQVYYDNGSNRRGPFTLWTNTGGALASVRYANILQTIDGLDGDAFTYYGTSGTLEFVTQDGDHKIQASVRTYNGNYSRTFPALADAEENTAATGRELIIPNISNNTTYRPSVVLFNPGTGTTSVAVKIIGSNGSQVGSTIARDLAAYQMSVITTEVRANTYSNASVIVSVTAGGRVLASGQTANNKTNDPAAHLAMQAAGSYPNSPGQRKMLTEVNWAAVSSGGTWISEVQVIDLTGGSVVQVYYNNGSNRRGPFTLWTNSGGARRSSRYANILQTIDGLDGGAFTYYGTSGSLELVTQDAGHLIHAAVRTTNGNYSRTFPALNDEEEHTAAAGRSLFIPNISNNASYRPSVVLFNPTGNNVTVEGKIVGTNGSQVGSTFTRELAAYQMSVVTTEVRADTYSNANIVIAVTAGSGSVIASGQTANNTTNDPAAHLAVQAE